MSTQTANLKTITTIIKRFPDHWDRIRSLIERDKEFEAICDEYVMASESLQHWKNIKTDIAQERLAEYKLIIKELEQEIERILQMFKNNEIQPNTKNWAENKV